MVCPKFRVDYCIYLLLMLYTHCQELMKFSWAVMVQICDEQGDGLILCEWLSY
jgi:hypothetical protein